MEFMGGAVQVHKTYPIHLSSISWILTTGITLINIMLRQLSPDRIVRSLSGQFVRPREPRAVQTVRYPLGQPRSSNYVFHVPGVDDPELATRIVTTLTMSVKL
ncbi:hypothetical protein BX600DRAFT_506175 [Xylariales sp. PMI_506]|nr:hypothetical protein BX600DRAFT_506175 [Xylariales sp. PMI_506]